MLAPNTVLQNRYRIINQIGKGGMGAVYLALDQRFVQLSKVAIKEVLFTEERIRKAFEHEAWLLNQLKHSALPRVTDYFSEGNSQFLVMEYISGEDLWEMMKRGVRFSVEEVLYWAHQLLDALDYLHTQQQEPIIHRDIKPHNIKLMENDNVVLIDFGAAKGCVGEELYGLSSMSVVGYTPNYAPIEQSLRTDESTRQTLGMINQMKLDELLSFTTDPRSDLYSLAATIYHLLTRAIPAAATTRIVARWMNNPDPLLLASDLNPDVPVPIAKVLHQSLMIEPDMRIQSAKEMGKALGIARLARSARGFDTQAMLITNKLGEKVTTVEPEYKITDETKPIENLLSDSYLPTAIGQETTEIVPLPKVDFVSDVETVNADPTTFHNDTEPHVIPALGSDSLAETANTVLINDSALPLAQPSINTQVIVDYPTNLNSQPPLTSQTEHYSQETVFKDSNPSQPLFGSFLHGKESKRSRMIIAGAVVSVLLIVVVTMVISNQFSKNTKESLGVESAAGANASSSINLQNVPEGMVFVPGGKMTMGRNDGEEFEKPAHSVIVNPYFIDITEVTREAYAKCLKAKQCPRPEGWSSDSFPEGTGKLPVTGVSWDAANSYAKFEGKRLPTEAEWEFAARGPNSAIYPWGSEWKQGKANANGSNNTFTKVGTFGSESVFGTADMIGNAWEWTADTYKLYSGAMPDEFKRGDFRVIRGGCWQSNQKSATATARYGWPARKSGDYGDTDLTKIDYKNTGFRCAKNVN